MKVLLSLMPLSACRYYFILCLLFIAQILPLSASDTETQNAENKYALGRGLHLLDNKLILGGYSNLQYSNLDDEAARLDLRSLSLMVNWQIRPRWQLFSELELVDSLTLESGNLGTNNANLDIERLYLEYTALPNLNIRFGKFLTPVGRWNQIHAAPLVWTVSRPLVSTLPFSPHTTGLSVNGFLQTNKGGLDYIIYLDASEALDPDIDENSFQALESLGTYPSRPNAFDNAVGAYFSYKQWSTSLELGLSLVNFRTRDIKNRKNLVGLNLFWQANRIELSSEAIYRYSEGKSNDAEWGGFIQAVIPVWKQLFAIGRYEKFYTEILDKKARNSSIALAYRPQPAVVYKLEYREGVDNIQLSSDGILASFAVLF